MIEMYVFAGIALLVAGVTIGVFVMICLGINRDDRSGGFPAHTNDQIARAARRVTGAAARRPELVGEGRRRQDILLV